MTRRFREHTARQLTQLSGIWDFAFLGDADPEAIEPLSIEFNDAIPVPGCFDATPRYAGKRGLVAYRCPITLAETTRHRIRFGAVHNWCRTFLIQGTDVKRLGDHSGGFTGFAMDIKGHQPGGADLIVLVDNRFDYERSPLHLNYFDWYHFGGITREVELHRLGNSWIDALRVSTIDWRERRVGVRLTIGSDSDAEVALSVEVDGDKVAWQTVSLRAGENDVELTLELPDAAPWSPAEPVLHSMRCTMGEDDQIERFGIREVTVEGDRIAVNGEAVRLLGFCRHAAHPQFGHAVPESIQVGDLQLIEELGCNFVRGTHYPQDPRFLDLCDERGILVWSEAIGWQHTAEHLTDRHFLDAQLVDIREMIATAANHPSVILWGIQNESESHVAENRPAYEELLGEIRSRDPSRPVTYASNHLPNDLCLDLVDVVSINTYPGWYVGEIDAIPDHMATLFERLEAPDAKGKPVIISEIGAGAIAGWHDQNLSRWSEEYQARLLDRVIRFLFQESNRACGLSLWQFCDGRTYDHAPAVMRRPRGFNNKGVVDEYRRPKLGFHAVKKAFTELRARR